MTEQIMIVNDDFVKCDCPVGDYALHCSLEQKNQIIQNQKIMQVCKFLDFDVILFALYLDLRIKHKNHPDSHLRLKIAQVKKLQSLIKNNSKWNVS